MGADAVIVYDSQKEGIFTMWPTRDYKQGTVTIPSVLINADHGEKLHKLLLKNSGDEGINKCGIYSSSSSCKGHSECLWDDHNDECVDQLEQITVTIRWGLPHPDGRVEFDYYTCADDFESFTFKENFPSVLELLGDQMVFTPHYFIMNGTYNGCHGDHNALNCGSDCTNKGRYCVQDPDEDKTNGLTGVDVMQENLRQMCVWEYEQQFMKDKVEEKTAYWFNYVKKFNDNCLGSESQKNIDNSTFHSDCSKQQMHFLDSSDGLWKYVMKCYEKSGGLGHDLDKPNTLFEKTLEMVDKHGVFACPTAVVNDFQLHGDWHCPSPVEIGTCNVMGAVCAGFAEGTTPKGCGGSPGCPAGEYYDHCQLCLPMEDPRWDNLCKDCKNELNGNAVETDCGEPLGKPGIYKVCESPEDTKAACEKKVKESCEYSAWDACGDCQDPNKPGFVDPKRVKNAKHDCKGTCQGSFEFICGVCVDPALTPNRDCGKVIPGGGSDSKTEKSSGGGGGTLTAVIVALVSLVVIAVVLIVFFMWKRMNQQDDEFRRLMDQYTMMEDNVGRNDNRQPLTG